MNKSSAKALVSTPVVPAKGGKNSQPASTKKEAEKFDHSKYARGHVTLEEVIYVK